MAKPKIARLYAATKSESSLLVLFIPSVDRQEREVQQQVWVDRALHMLGQLFGGATAFPKARGVWRDDARDGQLVFDKPVVTQCYTNEVALQEHAADLRAFLLQMGEATNQGRSVSSSIATISKFSFRCRSGVMARNVRKIARSLGARVVGKVPETGGGAFGAARLAALLRSRLTPSAGLRPGRPTDPNWIRHPKVPMSEVTFRRLERLAGELSAPGRRVSPMQVAAQLLESSIEQLSNDGPAEAATSR